MPVFKLHPMIASMLQDDPQPGPHPYRQTATHEMTDSNVNDSADALAKAANFCYSVRPLSNDRVSLVLFDPAIHLEPFFTLSSSRPELYEHTTFGPYGSAEELNDDFFRPRMANRSSVIFAVIDRTQAATPNSAPPVPELPGGGALAGIMGYLNSEPVNLSTEIGFMFTLPGFQRRRIASTGVGLLLRYALEPVEKGGLGLRRVQWQTNSLNVASRRLAEGMGFRFEGILRWQRIFHGGKVKGKVSNGEGTPAGGNEGDLGRHTAMLGISWDDWEGGERERVSGLLDRYSSSLFSA